MKKIVLILIIFLAATDEVDAQNNKIYVSRHGGSKKLLLFGKTGYDYYHFSNYLTTCDTLICSGAGYETCKIDKSIIKIAKEQGGNYPYFNKAIRATEKHLRKHKNTSGQFNLTINNKNLTIKYYNADAKGNVDIEIQVL